MIFVGILVTFLGFVISLLGVGLTSGVGTRMVAALLGIAVSLFGIIGLINKAYQQRAIWKK